MGDAPERIWATASDDGWLAPYCGLIPCKGATEYIRADLAPTDAKVMALVEALRPFDACVFDDNGDVTISTGHLSAKDWLRLRAALRDLEAP